MAEIVEMHTEPRRADRLIEDASAGGVETYVHWSKARNSLLFSLADDTPPTATAMAAVIEITTRFKANIEFRVAVEHYAIQIGAAVQNVDEPAWVWRELTATEGAILHADELRLNS